MEGAHHAGRTAEQAAAELKLPARFSGYVGDQPLPGLEFIGSGRDRARRNIDAIYAELDRRYSINKSPTFALTIDVSIGRSMNRCNDLPVDRSTFELKVGTL